MNSRQIVFRLIHTVLAMMFVSIIIFGLARVTGDPVALMAPQGASEVDLDRLRERLGIDKPIVEQYLRFLKLAVTGDFGTSISWDKPTLGLIVERFPATILLSAAAMTVALLIALPLGILTAVKRDTTIDSIGKIIALTGQSMPTFWLGIILILVFSLYLRLLPTSGYGTWQHIVLPAVTLGVFVAASIMRVTRSAMIDALQADYVRTARSKGISESRIVLIHTLRNASIPIVTMVSLQAATILRGAVVVETIFSWPGVGKLAVDAVYARDFPLVQASILFMALVFLLVNFGVDLLYAKLDPRIRYQSAP